MHFVLWGLHQLSGIQPCRLENSSFNALRALGSSSTGCKDSIEIPSQVSMHFVLWGLHQPGNRAAASVPVTFQCTSCFGVFINQMDCGRGVAELKFQCTSCFGVFINPEATGKALDNMSFNALRALGSSSTLLLALILFLSVFQCTSCFGVFINHKQVVPARILL